jgi:hypothetical protein
MSSPAAFFSTPPPTPTIAQRLSNLSTNMPLPIMVLTTTIVLIMVILFIVVRMKRGTLKSVSILKDSVVLANPMAGDYMISPGAKLPASNNGHEYTYSIWLFIDNLNITRTHKPVMYRGSSASWSDGCFYVFMDAKTNQLYAASRTNGAVDAANKEPTLEGIKNNPFFMRSTIDYVPLQRWVHVAYSIKDTTMSTFVDGELYSVTSVHELKARPDGSRPLPVQHKGDIMIAGKADKEGFNGYIGNGTYYNFAATMKEVRQIYNKGPYVSTWMSYFGLGVRSPIYRISSNDLK